MTSTIRIKDKTESGYLSFGLIDLLNVIGEDGSVYAWSVLDVEATGDPDVLDRDMLDIEREIKTSPRGLRLTWGELLSLARSLKDVLEATIVACIDVNRSPDLRLGCDLTATSEIVLEAVDSEYWQVFARDARLLKRLELAFTEVEMVNL